MPVKRVIKRVINWVPSSLARLLVRRFYHRPIFVVGTNRAGKSLLARALGTHPAVFTPFSTNEGPLLGYIGGVVAEIEACGTDSLPDSAIADPSSYIQRSVRSPVADCYSALRRICFESIAGRNFGLERVLRRLVGRRDLTILARRGRWCGEAFTPEAAYVGLRILFPEARFIYIVRHPVTAVEARIEAVQAKTNRRMEIAIPCRNWADGVAHYHFLTDAEGALPVRFETMATDTERFFEEIFPFAGLAPHPAPAKLVRATLLRSGSPVRDDLADPASTIEAWSAEERSIFLSICGPGMEKLGYSIQR